MNGVQALGSGDTSPGENARIRLLMFAEAVTLAHVARPLALARALDPARFDTAIACDPAVQPLVASAGIRALDASSIGSARFLRRLALGSPVFRARELAEYVERDLQLIAAERPDAIVGDFRLSLSISARLAQVPYLALTNAYWSPAGAPRFTVPELPISRLLGPRLAQSLFDVAMPFAISLHCRPLNTVRQRYGLAPLPARLAGIYTDADRVLYADAAECYPDLVLPPYHAFIGPILWSPDLPLPPWWHKVPDDCPIAFVSVGSSGQVRVVPRVIAACRQLDMTVLLAVAGRKIDVAADPRVFVADYLPAVETARRSALVVCNGGSPMTQIALAAARPVLGIPSNLDQYLNMQHLERFGVALLQRSESTDVTVLAGCLRRLLEDDTMRTAAAELAVTMAAYRPGERLAEQVLAAIRRPAPSPTVS